MPGLWINARVVEAGGKLIKGQKKGALWNLEVLVNSLKLIDGCPTGVRRALRNTFCTHSMSHNDTFLLQDLPNKFSRTVEGSDRRPHIE